MEVRVEKVDETDDLTRSKFYFNGELKGFGVEDEYRETKVHGETRIPDGTYDMDLRYSPKFSNSYFRDNQGNIIRSSKRNTEKLKKLYHTPHELIWVKEVPGFEYILWHWGNTDDDTHGCYLVGSSLTVIKGQLGVGASRAKYEEIYPILWKAIKTEKVIVTYERDEQQSI